MFEDFLILVKDSYNDERLKELVMERAEYRYKCMIASTNPKYHYEPLKALIVNFNFLNEYYIFDETQRFIKNKIIARNKKMFDKSWIGITLNPSDICSSFNNCNHEKIYFDAPNFSGLYLIGQVNADPFTDEKFYWLKVGESKQIDLRMKQYRTSNPMVWHIGYQQIEDMDNRKEVEKYYQNILRSKSLEISTNADEWFLVSKEVYLDICKNGFNTFSD